MKISLYIVIDSQDLSIIKDVKRTLVQFCDCSFSPVRSQTSLNNCSELFATIDTSDLKQLLPMLNKYWSIEQEKWADYGFNTPMFHPHVYYLEIFD